MNTGNLVMVSRNQKIKNITDRHFNELENILGAMLAPVTPRGEFVDQLQQRLELKYNPQSMLIIPSKLFNFFLFSLAVIFGGVILVIYGGKWIKQKKKAKWDMLGIQANTDETAKKQIPGT